MACKKEGILTAKQKKFCEAYVLCYNQVQAYHEAFPEASIGTCKSAAAKLMKKDEILDYVHELQKYQ